MTATWCPSCRAGTCGAHGEFPPGVDMCRDCGEAHAIAGPCPIDCEHKHVSQEDWGGEERAFLCLDCDNWVSPTGPDDEDGHPTWEYA